MQTPRTVHYSHTVTIIQHARRQYVGLALVTCSSSCPVTWGRFSCGMAMATLLALKGVARREPTTEEASS